MKRLGTILSVLLPLVICACRQTPGRGGYEAGYIEPLPPLGIPRTCHVLMDLDGELTVIGGHTTGFVPTKTAEYLSNGKWHTVESLYPHDYSLAVRLPSGDVLVAGGMNDPFGKGLSLGAESYHHDTHSFSPLPILDTARAVCSGAVLSDGTIIVSGNWYGSDCIAAYSTENGGAPLKAASQPRSSPYILPSAPDNALILSGYDTHGRTLDTLVIDRFRGAPFTDTLFAAWRPIRLESNILPERTFIGNPALGAYASLIPIRRNEDGQVAFAKQAGEQFSLLETDVPVPMTGASRDSIVWGQSFADVAASKVYLVGVGTAKEHIFVCIIDYGKALQGSKAQVRLLSANHPVSGWDLQSILLPGGRIAVVGGNAGDNYNPLADAFIFHTEPFQGKRMLPLFPFLLLGALVLLVGWLIFRRKRPGRDDFPEREPSSQGLDMASRIAALVEGRQLYLRKGLKVQDIATELGTNSTYISACINGQWGMSFPEYLGRLRVRHAQEQMRSHPDWPLHRVADESGFSGEASFYRIFKSATDLTPSEWLKHQTQDPET